MHTTRCASEAAIGALFLVNSLLIIAAQLPTAKAVEGKRRARALALMAALFASCWLLVLTAGYARPGYPLLLAGIVVLSVGECLYDAVRTPLIANLAPEGLTGRYLAAAGLSSQLGFILGPAIGATLLGASPPMLWSVAAVVCALACAAALRLDSTLPSAVRTTSVRTTVRPAA